MSTTTTKPRNVTYLGVPARVWEVRTAGPTGLRVQVTEWLGDEAARGTKLTPAVKGDVVLDLIKGDGRKPSFQRLGRKVLTSPATAKAEAHILLWTVEVK